MARRRPRVRHTRKCVHTTRHHVPLTYLSQLTQLEHVLKRPDSYIGSVEKLTQQMWVWDSDTKRMVQREITYVPGFFKIIDEILVNAADNKVRVTSPGTRSPLIATRRAPD